MTQLKYAVPSVGEKNTIAEPKVDVALNEIKTVVNGELDNENLKAGGVAKSNLSAELKAELSSFVGLPLEARKSIVATEQERESVVFGTLPTPDEVEVTLAENGLMAIAYQATWWSTAAAAGKAAIFLGGNQLKVAPESAGTVPVVQEAKFNGPGGFETVLATTNAGLVSANIASEHYGGDVTTGQILGPAKGSGGIIYVFAAAGTYKVSVRFAATSAKVKAKNRKLWVWVIG